MTPSPDIRWQQRLQNFERALALLSEAMEGGPAALNQLEKEGAVQRFEYTLELAWKTLKDYLEASGIVLNAITPRQVIKDAFAAWHPLLRIWPGTLYVVRAGFCRGLLVQGPGCLSVLQRPPNGADSCASRRPRHSPGARAAVGDLCPEAVALLSR